MSSLQGIGNYTNPIYQNTGLTGLSRKPYQGDNLVAHQIISEKGRSGRYF